MVIQASVVVAVQAQPVLLGVTLKLLLAPAVGMSALAGEKVKVQPLP
jgi:hypothetical protein